MTVGGGSGVVALPGEDAAGSRGRGAAVRVAGLRARAAGEARGRGASGPRGAGTGGGAGRRWGSRRVRDLRFLPPAPGRMPGVWGPLLDPVAWITLKEVVAGAPFGVVRDLAVTLPFCRSVHFHCVITQ